MAITEKMVTKFARRTARLAWLKEIQEDLKKEILAELKKGEFLPDSGPFTILLSPVGGKEFSWEEEYEELLTSKLRKEKLLSDRDARKMAQARMKKLKEKAPDKESVVVHGETYVGGVKMSPRPRIENKKAVAA